MFADVGAVGVAVLPTVQVERGIPLGDERGPRWMAQRPLPRPLHECQQLYGPSRHRSRSLQGRRNSMILLCSFYVCTHKATCLSHVVQYVVNRSTSSRVVSLPSSSSSYHLHWPLLSFRAPSNHSKDSLAKGNSRYEIYNSKSTEIKQERATHWLTESLT